MTQITGLLRDSFEEQLCIVMHSHVPGAANAPVTAKKYSLRASILELKNPRVVRSDPHGYPGERLV
jgi:hypothetical protein